MKEYLILIRPYGMLFLGFTPVFGAIANKEFNYLHLTALLTIGLLAHIFTFVQNDYYDIVIDSKSKYVSNRPLVKGSITRKKALSIYIASFFISLFIAVWFLFSYYSFFVLLLSFLFITIYNKYSKKFFGMEYILGMGVFTFGIYGALTVSNIVSNLAIVVSFFGFMQWLFSVGISANLKDVEYDSRMGIKTTPTKFGVSIFAVALPLLLGYTSIFVYNLPIPGVLFLLVALIVFYYIIKILKTPVIEREKMLIYAGLQEGLSLLLLPIMLLSVLIDVFGTIQTFLLVLLLIFWPLFWFRVLYGKKMIPLE